MPRITPFARGLLVTLLVVFVAELVVDNWLQIGDFSLVRLLLLDVANPDWKACYQVLTHVFVYQPNSDGVRDVLLGCLGIWWMVSPFEAQHGTKRAIQLCLVATLAAAACALVAGRFFQEGLIFGMGPVTLGALAAFAITLGQQPVSFFGLITVKAIHMLWLSFGISVLVLLATKNVPGFAGDLGAIGGCIAYARWLAKPRAPRPPSPPKKKPVQRHGLRVIEGGEGNDGKPRWLN